MNQLKFYICVLILLLVAVGCQPFPTKSAGSSITMATFTPGSTSAQSEIAPVEVITFTPGPFPTGLLKQTSMPKSTVNSVKPTATMTPIPENNMNEPMPLEVSNPDSIADWIAYSLNTMNAQPFSQIILSDTVTFGPGMMAMREDVSRDEFLKRIEERIQSKPTCVGYTVQTNDGHNLLSIWTKGWSPKWVDIGNGQSDELVFQFSLPLSANIPVNAFFLPSSAILEVIDGVKPCLDMAGNQK